MLTPEQEKWVGHLSDTKKVLVVSFDPACEENFLIIKNELQNLLGRDQIVLHRGASALHISGQDEIDAYVPVLPYKYDATVGILKSKYGEPSSSYPLKRTHFATLVGEKHIDIFVVNMDDADWIDSESFYNYLLTHPDDLKNYEKLKENASGKSLREYYKEKIEFINRILDISRRP